MVPYEILEENRKEKKKKVAISYSGGKDSTYVNYLLSQDPGYEIVCLVMFVPETTKPFLAHPLEIVNLQARLLGLPLLTLVSKAIPSYMEGYRANLKYLNEVYGVEVLATGDVLEGCSNFMVEACQPTKVSLLRPLFHCDVENTLKKFFGLGFQVFISCIDLSLVQDGRKFVGRLLTPNLLNQFDTQIDRMGELGEYHTLCIYAPNYLNQGDLYTLVTKEGLGYNLPDDKTLLGEDEEVSEHVKLDETGRYASWDFKF